jgi:SAM-dependent methyltransferase
VASDQRRVWTAIADAFDRTRQKPWPHVAAFIEALPTASVVLDLMSGNGRHSRVAAEAAHHPIALDWSLPLVSRAPGDRVLADATRLPLRDGAVDAAVYCAGLHGLPTGEGRMASLRELLRVLRPGGAAQVTVWSRQAPRFVAMDLPPGPADVVVPWKSGSREEQRHYHLYTDEALERDLEAAGFQVKSLKAVSIAEPEDNLVAVVRR